MIVSKKFECKPCGIRFTQSSSLKSHEKKIHDRVKTIQCEFCEKLFHTNCELKFQTGAFNIYTLLPILRIENVVKMLK